MEKLSFSPVTVEAIDHIRAYAWASRVQNCDFAVANTVCWQFLYKTEYAEACGCLLLRFRLTTRGRLAYMVPVGAGDMAAAVRLLAADAAARGEDLRLFGVSDVQRGVLEAMAPAVTFHFTNDRNYQDYIYDRKALATLSGKALQPKRNHINRFRRLYPDYEYDTLSEKDFADCLTLAREWAEAHADEEGTLDEARAIAFAFAHYGDLGLRGGVLRVAGRVVAFTYGSAVRDDTFDVHVEKADIAYDGAYTMINQCFVAHLPDTFTYVNREEDLGIEGLRRAKLSYAPVLLLDKWMAVLKTEIADDALRARLRRLWQTVFRDDDAFLDTFFAKYYHRDRLLCTLQDGQPVAVLYMLPVADTERTERRLAYIYAVATDPAHRRRGLMTLLLERLSLHLGAADYDAAVLLPARAELRPFYARAGFVDAPSWTFRHDAAYRFLHDAADMGEAMVLPISSPFDATERVTLALENMIF